MIVRTLITAVLAVPVAASGAFGALSPAAPLAEAESAPAAAPHAQAESAPAAAPGQAGTTISEGDVLVPGGMRFILAAAGMRRAAINGDLAEDFLPELAAYLSAPMVLDYAERVEAMVAELREVQSFMTELDQRHGEGVPSCSTSSASGSSTIPSASSSSDG